MNPVISGLRGFTFNGKHNNDLGVVMEKKVIQFPSKKKIKESVPFMQGSYDFSTIGSNGEIVFEEREITITLGLPGTTKEQLQVLYSNVLEWIVDAGKQRLVFDAIKDYYFLAEVESNSTLEETMEYGQLELTFTADPFKKSIEYVGSDIWDIFNFEEDYAQDIQYVINGSRTIRLYNPGRTVRPIINSSVSMSFVYNGITYNINTGDNRVYGFYLKTGANDLTFNGTGTIKFIFQKEVL